MQSIPKRNKMQQLKKTAKANKTKNIVKKEFRYH